MRQPLSCPSGILPREGGGKSKKSPAEAGLFRDAEQVGSRTYLARLRVRGGAVQSRYQGVTPVA